MKWIQTILGTVNCIRTRDSWACALESRKWCAVCGPPRVGEVVWSRGISQCFFVRNPSDLDIGFTQVCLPRTNNLLFAVDGAKDRCKGSAFRQ